MSVNGVLGQIRSVKLRDEEWQPLYDLEQARDWIFPIEALAFGDHDDDFTEWVDSDEKRQGLIDELPVAVVLIYRFWQERRRATQTHGAGSRRGSGGGREPRRSGMGPRGRHRGRGRPGRRRGAGAR